MQMMARLGEFRRGAGRAVERQEATRPAAIRPLGASGRDVVLRDLSTRGFAVDGDLALAIGTFVWLRIPGGMGLNARVVWREGSRHGCEFIVPISEAACATALAADASHASP